VFFPRPSVFAFNAEISASRSVMPWRSDGLSIPPATTLVRFLSSVSSFAFREPHFFEITRNAVQVLRKLELELLENIFDHDGRQDVTLQLCQELRLEDVRTDAPVIGARVAKLVRWTPIARRPMGSALARNIAVRPTANAAPEKSGKQIF
jgi:hypothetical protein